MWSDAGPKAENPSLSLSPCPTAASLESLNERIPTENAPPEWTPPFVPRHPPIPLGVPWKQTSKLMLLLVASQGSQTLKLEAGFLRAPKQTLVHVYHTNLMISEIAFFVLGPDLAPRWEPKMALT